MLQLETSGLPLGLCPHSFSGEGRVGEPVCHSPNTVCAPALTSKTNHHELSPWGQAQGHGEEGQRCLLYHLWEDSVTLRSPARGTGPEAYLVSIVHRPAFGGGYRRLPLHVHQGPHTPVSPYPKGRRRPERGAGGPGPVESSMLCESCRLQSLPMCPWNSCL